jgi:hypothetical protein
MAFFESKSGFWLMFAVFVGIVALTLIIRIENIMNYWNTLTSFAKKI